MKVVELNGRKIVTKIASKIRICVWSIELIILKISKRELKKKERLEKKLWNNKQNNKRSKNKDWKRRKDIE